MTSKEAKQVAIESYIEKLGFAPSFTRKGGNEIWYKSPLKEDKTPSFKITLDKNTWYDFALSKGGTLIDFIMAYFSCSVGEAFKILSSNSFPSIESRPKISAPINTNTLELKSIKDLNNSKLIEYVKSRGIDEKIAKAYLKEIYYKYSNKKSNFFAVGIKNRSEGYEIRCSIFKGCLIAKDFTFYPLEGSDAVSIFEGLFDFLALLTERNIESLTSNVIILNSLMLLPSAIEFIKVNKYKKAFLFLDNDDSGNNATSEFSNQFEGMAKDMRYLYAEHKDYNEKLIIKKGMPRRGN